MMATTFFDIQAAMDGQLNTISGTYSIAWQNVPYEPTIGTPFLRPTMLPAGSEAATVGATGTDEHLGIYQVDVFTPAGDGKKDAIEIADIIADLFKPVTELTYNGVTVRCMAVSITQALREEAWNQIPVNIRYMAHPTKR